MQLLPGNMETADAQLTTPGRAILNCNIADHVNAGAFLPLPALLLQNTAFPLDQDMSVPRVIGLQLHCDSAFALNLKKSRVCAVVMG